MTLLVKSIIYEYKNKKEPGGNKSNLKEVIGDVATIPLFFG